MAEIQNFGILSNLFTISFLCFEDSKSKNTKISKLSDLKKLFSRIKKNENKQVCVCLQFDGVDITNDLPKCICLKTVYAVCPLPNHLNNAAEEDIEKASISVHPPSNLNVESILKLSEREIHSIRTCRVQHVYNFEENNLTSDYAKRSYRQKYGSAKVKKKSLFTRSFSSTTDLNVNSKIKNVSAGYCRSFSTEFLESMTMDYDEEIFKSDRYKMNEDPNHCHTLKNDKNYKKRQAHYVNKSTTTKKPLSNISKDLCSTNRKTQRKQNKSPQLLESSSESETSLRPCTFLQIPCITNCMPVKKEQKSSYNQSKIKGSKRDSKLSVVKKRFSQMEHCSCCTHNKTMDKIVDLKCKSRKINEQVPNLGKGIIQLNGISYEATIKLVASNQEKGKTIKGSVDSNFKERSQNRNDSCEQNKFCYKILPIKGDEKLGSANDTAVKQPEKVSTDDKETVKNCPCGQKNSNEVKKSCSYTIKKGLKSSTLKLKEDNHHSGSNDDDDDAIQSLVFAEEPRPNKSVGRQPHKFDDIPGFSFKLNRCKMKVDKASNRLIDKHCLIREQEQERFVHQTTGMQPLTIIMNEPYNIPLRIYEASPLKQQRYLSTKI